MKTKLNSAARKAEKAALREYKNWESDWTESDSIFLAVYDAVFQDAEGEECAPDKAAVLYLDCERISMRGEQGKRENDGSDMLHFVVNRIAQANKWELEPDYDRDGDSESLSIALPRA